MLIGQDGQQVFERHGGKYVRIHPCGLMTCSDADHSAADLAIKETAEANKVSARNDKVDTLSNDASYLLSKDSSSCKIQ